MMETARVVTACPVSQDVVLCMPMHVLQPRKHYQRHVAVVSTDILASTVPLHRLQVHRQFAGMCEHRRTSPAAATLLSMVPLIMQRPAN